MLFKLFLILSLISLQYQAIAQNPTCDDILNTNSQKVDSMIKHFKNNAIKIYYELKLNTLGLSRDAFITAYLGYNNLNANKILTNRLLTIIDLTLNSSEKRFFTIDLEKKKIIFHTYVSHGINSSCSYDKARFFSDHPNSKMTSIGFYKTGFSYNGQHGLSLKLEGMDSAYNDSAFIRFIVLHSTEIGSKTRYASESFINKNKHIGRSYGCTVVPENLYKLIISKVKGGSCLFIYFPNEEYLRTSLILNSGYLKPFHWDRKTG